ncbi:KH domain-containing protein [Patescibacteria group bacterium]|nr:KH domain-containing protein [Patescibacteria group bacterium]
MNEALDEQQNRTQEIADIISEILSSMGVESRVSIEENLQGFTFNISSPDSNLLIGQRGANLYALQVLVFSIVNKRFGHLPRFALDVDDYKKKREWYLRETAKKAIEHIKRTGRAVALPPMSPHDRRVIHAFISADMNYDTESIGQDPNRRIVIRPKQKGDLF